MSTNDQPASPDATDADALFNFPCEFPIKVMGRRQDGFAQTIGELVLRHAPDFDLATIEMRSSSSGRFLSLTCTITAHSRAQLDAIYGELSGHPMVVMAL